jgi:hypothetical protein
MEASGQPPDNFQCGCAVPHFIYMHHVISEIKPMRSYYAVCSKNTQKVSNDTGRNGMPVLRPRCVAFRFSSNMPAKYMGNENFTQIVIKNDNSLHGAESFKSLSQEIRRILWNPKVLCRVHKDRFRGPVEHFVTSW